MYVEATDKDGVVWLGVAKCLDLAIKIAKRDNNNNNDLHKKASRKKGPHKVPLVMPKVSVSWTGPAPNGYGSVTRPGSMDWEDFIKLKRVSPPECLTAPISQTPPVRKGWFRGR